MQRELAAEFVGTFSLVSAVCGSALFSAPQAGLLAVAFAVGLSVMAMAFAVGHISGAHFNPAVTCGLVAANRLPAERAVAYIIVQVFAGAAAAGVFYIVLSGAPPAKWNTFTDYFQFVRQRRFLDGCGVPDRNGDYSPVPGGNRWRDIPARTRRICANRNRTCTHDVSLGRHPYIERLAQSGAVDRDCDLRRRSGHQCAVVILGRPDPWRCDRRLHLPMAPGRSAKPESTALVLNFN